jgi:hypothetical protein
MLQQIWGKLITLAIPGKPRKQVLMRWILYLSVKDIFTINKLQFE